MSMLRVLNIAEEVFGLPVLEPDTGQPNGHVTELIVHPTKGKLLGLICKTTAGLEQSIASTAAHFFQQPGAVWLARNALPKTLAQPRALAGGVAIGKHLLGVSVVSEEGAFLGLVSAAYLHAEPPLVSYRVTKSKFQKLWGGELFIAGNIPLAWSPIGARLIVPAETATRLAAPSLQALDARQLARSHQTRPFQWVRN